MDPTQVAAIAACATVLVMALGTIQTWMMINEMKTAREGQATPTLTLNANSDVDNKIVVRNSGPGIARNIMLTFTYRGPTSIPEITHEPFNLGVGGQAEFSAGFFPGLTGKYYVTAKAQCEDIYGRTLPPVSREFPLIVGVSVF